MLNFNFSLNNFFYWLFHYLNLNNFICVVFVFMLFRFLDSVSNLSNLDVWVFAFVVDFTLGFHHFKFI